MGTTLEVTSTVRGVQTTLIDINRWFGRNCQVASLAYLLASFPLFALQQAEVQAWEWEMVLVQA